MSNPNTNNNNNNNTSPLDDEVNKQNQLRESMAKIAEQRRIAERKKMKVLPRKMDKLAQRLIQETDVMQLPEALAIEYVERVTEHRISVMRYYSLKKGIHEEDAAWFFNYSSGGYIRAYRERLFVYDYLLQNGMRQYNLELSTKPHEAQDPDRINKLSEHILKVNTLLAQYQMATPVLVAMKIANDPKYASIRDIVDEDEKKEILLKYHRDIIHEPDKVPVLEDESVKGSGKDYTNYKNKRINELNREIGHGIAERQTGIRYPSGSDEERKEDSNSFKDGSGSGNGGENTGETETEGDGLSEGEREYRKQKERAVF